MNHDRSTIWPVQGVSTVTASPKPCDLHHPGEPDRVVPGEGSLPPLLRQPAIVAIDPEPPGAGEVAGLRGGAGPARRGQTQQAGERPGGS